MELKSYEFEIVQKARAAFEKGKTITYEFRLNQLKQIYRMLDDHKESIIKSLGKFIIIKYAIF